MDDPDDFIVRNGLEHALIAIAAGSVTPDGYVLPPMPLASIARLVMMMRRSRALRRRGAHTKAARRARARAYYRATGEALR